jgi:hypothetical protein
MCLSHCLPLVNLHVWNCPLAHQNRSTTSLAARTPHGIPRIPLFPLPLHAPSLTIPFPAPPGVAWFGMEDDGATLHGLDQRKFGDIADGVLAHGFNALRFTVSLDFALNLDEEIVNYDHLRKLMDEVRGEEEGGGGAF